MAQRLAGEIEAAEDFELMAPVPLALLCLRYRPAGVDDPAEIDAINETLLERVNDSGLAYLTHTRLGGRYVIRFRDRPDGDRMAPRRGGVDPAV